MPGRANSSRICSTRPGGCSPAHKISLDNSLQSRQEEALAKLRLYAMSERAHEKLWAQLDTSYFLRHEPQEIAWHTRLLYYRVETTTPMVKARLSPAGEGLQVMVYVPDQKELFARICGFFEGISYDIYEAKIYTTRHGYALDSFQVHDPNNKRPQYRDLISYIEYELGERLPHQAPLPAADQAAPGPPAAPLPDHAGGQHPAGRTRHLPRADRSSPATVPGCCRAWRAYLTAYDINLQYGQDQYAGSRAEDVFLITGAALSDPKTGAQARKRLVEQLRT